MNLPYQPKAAWKRHFLIVLLLLFSLAGCAEQQTERIVQLDNNGTMVDTRVGLMWQRNRFSQQFVDPLKAENYAQSLSLAGFTDWRLPTSQELWDLYFTNDYSMAGKLAKYVTMKGSYWTKDESRIIAGYLDEGDDPGINRYYINSKKGYVRAVRTMNSQ